MSDKDALASDQDALAAFRAQWRAELNSRQSEGPQKIYEPVASTSARPSVPFVPARPARQGQELGKDALAVEVYSQAVLEEKQGRLNEATMLYRRAFRMDPDVEQSYALYAAVQSKEAQQQDPVDALDFEFSRTVQTTEDYVESTASDQNHPSSTVNLRKKVLDAIAKHPFARPGPKIPGKEDEEPEMVPEENQLAYHAAKLDLPNRFALLPPECIIQILVQLVVPSDERHYPRIEEFEARFARICRRARLDTLEPALWRAVCERVYRTPQIPEGETPSRLVRKHGLDWRRMYLSQPRLRTDGCFIGVQRYVRRGHQESAWVSPSFQITYYRMLRLYSDGRCVSLQTTTEPGDIVRQLQPDLRITGLLVGQWTLSLNGILRCKLEDPALPLTKRKYSFELDARLKSTSRGRMNKLEIMRLATCRRETLEVEELPLGHEHGRPFFFSSVTSYEST